MRPRLLLVPEFTELQWTIKSDLEQWAEVRSFDPPGVGGEPRPEDLTTVSRRLVVERGPAAPAPHPWFSFRARTRAGNRPFEWTRSSDADASPQASSNG